MPSQVTNYKCPACAAPLHFAEDSGKLQCDYCGSIYEVEEIEALYAEQNEKAAAAKEAADAKGDAFSEWDAAMQGEDWDPQGMKAYECPSCGAQLVCDETTAATSCPYCGNPTIIPGQFKGMKRPDYVLPFKLNKEAAVQALKQHYTKKFLLPNAFKSENHLEEVKGVYVPFWLFDTVVDADVRFQGIRSHTHREGDDRVTDTEYFVVCREGLVKFERVPADGSSKMPDEFMDSIEPFDYSELKPFSEAYLPGFLADKYDVDSLEAVGRADGRCRQSAYELIQKTVKGYDSLNIIHKHLNLQHADVKYALMPVWVLSTKWNDQNFLFAMNGQTGKFVGDLPVDKKKAQCLFWGVAAGLSVNPRFLFAGPLGGFFSALL